MQASSTIVITGGMSLLSKAIADAWSRAATIRASCDADFREPEVARELVAGADTVVHLAPLFPSSREGASARERLDRALRGTSVLLAAAAAADVRRVILGSSLALFERYPTSWAVGETWRPRPDADDVAQLCLYLAEESAKQIARVAPLAIVCLRFGAIVDEAAVSGRSYDPRWLHVEDAVHACSLARSVPLAAAAPGVGGESPQGWVVYHVPGGGPHPRTSLARAGEPDGLGYQPRHAFSGQAATAAPVPTDAERSGDLAVLGPRVRTPSRPIRNVVIFGAGGPLGAVTARLLAPSYRLRLTDVRSLADIVAEGKPQSVGAPMPALLEAPHEYTMCDVSDLASVEAACDGMDAVVNCTVVRPHPAHAFLVNAIGAYHVARAAADHGIRRVVQTGPQLVTMDRPAGYWWDFGVPDDAPPRAGDWLYGHTKYLGQEAVRLIAEQYDLEVPVLLFSSFVDPASAEPRPGGPFPMSVSWEDAGHAMRRALEVPTLPSPFELFHILADLPHGKYSNEKAKRLLGWQPRDRLERLWIRNPDRET